MSVEEQFETLIATVRAYNPSADFDAIERAFTEAKSVKGKPTAIIAKSVKGKGVSFMENTSAWHGKKIDDESYAKAMAELGGEMNG